MKIVDYKEAAQNLTPEKLGLESLGNEALDNFFAVSMARAVYDGARESGGLVSNEVNTNHSMIDELSALNYYESLSDAEKQALHADSINVVTDYIDEYRDNPNMMRDELDISEEHMAALKDRSQAMVDALDGIETTSQDASFSIPEELQPDGDDWQQAERTDNNNRDLPDGAGLIIRTREQEDSEAYDYHVTMIIDPARAETYAGLSSDALATASHYNIGDDGISLHVDSTDNVRRSDILDNGTLIITIAGEAQGDALDHDRLQERLGEQFDKIMAEDGPMHVLNAELIHGTSEPEQEQERDAEVVAPITPAQEQNREAVTPGH